MDAFPGVLDVRTFQVADFTNPETCGKHETEDGLIFDVSDRKKKRLHFLPGRNKGNEGIKLPERELIRIPGSVQDINVEESELGDTCIDSTVRESTCMLKPEDKIPHMLPGSIIGRNAGNIRKILKVSRNISGIRNDCMVSKATEGKHFPERIKINVHNRTS